MTTPRAIIMFPTGSTAFFDAKGEQVPELQVPWILLFARHAAGLGYDPEGWIIELPSGRKAQIFSVHDPDTGGKGWNWSLLP